MNNRGRWVALIFSDGAGLMAIRHSSLSRARRACRGALRGGAEFAAVRRRLKKHSGEEEYARWALSADDQG